MSEKEKEEDVKTLNNSDDSKTASISQIAGISGKYIDLVNILSLMTFVISRVARIKFARGPLEYQCCTHA